MKIHEYQAKQILAKYGASVPKGKSTDSASDAKTIMEELGTASCVVKAQIHAGGRGKGGGVKLAHSLEEAQQHAQSILGMQLITHQTGAEGQKVKQILIEEGMEIAKELYCSLLVDRGSKSIVFLASTEGGMDIEEVAAKTPEKITKINIDPLTGFKGYQATRLAYALKLDEIDPKLIRSAAKLFQALYQCFVSEDCSLLEINPLTVTKDGRILALDAKMIFDDNALFRHKDLLELRDEDEEDALEIQASEADLNYIKLDGTIGCMVNGAGLAMGTMDLIKLYGAEPANFLDVGGTATKERVTKAFEIITSDPKVKAILINIFGGIVQCDVVASGVVEAFKAVNLSVPVVVRLQGSNAEKAREIINSSGLGERLQMISDLKTAAQTAVKSI